MFHYGCFIHTCSVVFRNNLNLAKELPSWWNETENCDWVLNILNAQKGKIKYLKDVMALYRIHKNGNWSKRSSVEKHQLIIKTYENLEKHFYQNKNYLYYILKGKAGTYYELAKEFNKLGSKCRAVKNVALSWHYSPDKFNLKKYPGFLKQVINQFIFDKG